MFTSSKNRDALTGLVQRDIDVDLAGHTKRYRVVCGVMSYHMAVCIHFVVGSTPELF